MFVLVAGGAGAAPSRRERNIRFESNTRFMFQFTWAALAGAPWAALAMTKRCSCRSPAMGLMHEAKCTYG